MFRVCFPKSIPDINYYASQIPNIKIDAQLKRKIVQKLMKRLFTKVQIGLDNLRGMLKHPGPNSSGKQLPPLGPKGKVGSEGT